MNASNFADVSPSPPDSAQTGDTLRTNRISYDKQHGIERAGAEDEVEVVDWTVPNDQVILNDPDIPDVPYEHENTIHVIDWDDINDPGNPYNFSNRRKWTIVGTALVGTFITSFNATSITVAAGQIGEQFGVSDASFPNRYWPVFSWTIGGAMFIVVGLPLTEDLGVRRGVLLGYALFVLMVIPQAFAKNFETLVISRFFAGGLAVLPAGSPASAIPDLWSDGKGRSLPISLFNLSFMLGITSAPPIFAAVMEAVNDWRWIFYIQLMVYTAYFPALYFFLEETRGAVILRDRARKTRTTDLAKRVFAPIEINAPTLRQVLIKSTYRPIYLLFTEPILACVSLWSAFSLGNIFLFTQSTEQVFTALYGWDSYDSGYVQIAVVVGELFGWAATLCGLRLYLGSAKRNTEIPGKPIPEARLYVSILGSFVGIVGGMLVYGWTSYPSVPWIAPTIGLAMVGFGQQTVICAVTDYVEDLYAPSDYGASAIGALAVVENSFAGFLPLTSSKMYTALGFHWASSLLGLIAMVISCAPVLFVCKGRWFRQRSPFMSTEGQSAPSITISSRASMSTNREDLDLDV